MIRGYTNVSGPTASETLGPLLFTSAPPRGWREIGQHTQPAVNHLFSNAAVLWANAPAAPANAPASPLGGLGGMIIPLVLVMVAFYFILLRPQRREQAARQAMIDQLKKNDRIVTAGGIFGVVTNVNKDGDEVTVKVDESTNTKLRMARSSIARVVVDEPAGDIEKK